MRLPRTRFTIRRMMVVVAVFALLLGAVAIVRRQAHLQRLADYHAKMAWQLQSSHGTVIRPNGAFVHVPLTPQRLADYHEDLARKYERAARYPWLPVEPDPPEPE
jgi:hypothetical protein